MIDLRMRDVNWYIHVHHWSSRMPSTQRCLDAEQSALSATHDSAHGQFELTRVVRRGGCKNDMTYLESLVLKHPLDGSILPAWRQLCLEDDTE